MEKSNLNQPESHIKEKQSISPDDYMKDRVILKMNRYISKSEQYRLLYHLTSVVTIICSASVPVLINLGVHILVPTILSLVVTILVSLEKLFHFREHWRNYDAIAAFLRSEQLQFQTRAGVYHRKGAKSQAAFLLYVKRIEAGIKDERNDTIGMRTKDNE